MVEVAEAKVIVNQIKKHIVGKTIERIEIKNISHKFAWFNQKDEIYHQKLSGSKIIDAKQSGSRIRIILENNNELVLSEDIYFNYINSEYTTKKNQLILFFNDETALEIKIKLYGFFFLGLPRDLITNYYYQRSLEAIDIFDDNFTYAYFIETTKLNSNKGSIKQALATNQNIPGLGNGMLQDILFSAKLQPQRLIKTLSEDEKRCLYQEVIRITRKMFEENGRDSVGDLFGRCGNYHPVMKSNKDLCPICSNELIKKNYLGGKVIYCMECQK